MLKHVSNTPTKSGQRSASEAMEDLSSLSSFSGSDVEEGEDNDSLVRHVWDQYTNSKTDLTKARDRLENISALRTPDNIATAPNVEMTEQSKISYKEPLSGKVEVPEDSKSKVLQLNKKPSMNLTGTGSKDSESVGSALTRMFGSKVNSYLVMLLLFVCLLLYLVLLILTVKAASCADKLEQLQEIADQQRKEWTERIKTTLL